MRILAVRPDHRPTTQFGAPLLPQIRYWFLLSLVVVLAVLAVGWDVTRDPLDTGEELAVDQYLSLHHVVWLNPVAETIAVVLSPVGAVLITALIAALVWWRRNLWWAVSFAGTVACGWLFVGIIKLVIARPRPAPWALADPLMPEINNASFPSGHTAFTTALMVGLVLLTATSVNRSVRARWWIVALAGAVFVAVVALSRVYMGVHYPSDVLCAIPTAVAGCCFATGLWNTVVARWHGKERVKD